MKIGVFRNGWWAEAARRLGHEVVELPVAAHASGHDYAADAAARLANGRELHHRLHGADIQFLLDNGGTGLGFLPQPDAPDRMMLLHEISGKPLVSHFIDPLTTSFQGLDWSVVWPCLQSRGWVKAVWDRAQAAELQRFGVPNVIHLPMGAPDRAYPFEPVAPDRCRRAVSFVGGQNSTYFDPGVNVPSKSLLPGLITQAARGDHPGLSFLDVYLDVYGLREPVRADDPPETAVEKTAEYFRAKLFHHAALCIRNRDRYVIFLRRKLGDMFHLAGSRWDVAYGMRVEPPFPTTEGFLNHFRETAINLNLVNGNAETGLNMRPFEITAVGGFLLSQNQPELGECFDIGKECAAFSGEEELLDKIHYYLSHPEERTEIARAGQRRTLSQHLYSHRLRSLMERLRFHRPHVVFSTRHCDEDFKELLPHPDVIIDCGANVGQMARGLRRLYPRAEIYSFEPVSQAYELLREASRELNLRPVKKAVADASGTARMHLTVGSEAHSLLEFLPRNPCEQWTRVVGTEEVEVCTLDEWCEEQSIDPRRVDLLKLDVQGAELKALAGARNLLKYVRLVYLEVCFERIYKECPLLDDIDRFLTKEGFRRHALYPSDQPHLWGDALYVRK